MVKYHFGTRPQKSAAGLTLVELLVALTIIGILAAIAYPSYLDQVRKSRRAVAKSALLDAANREEQYFFSHRAYTSSLTDLDYSDPAYFGKDSTNSADNADAVYALSVVAVDNADCGTAPCFKLQAVPQNDQANDTACGTFTLTSDNQKDGAGSDCW